MMISKKEIAISCVAALMLYQIWYMQDFGSIPLLLQVLAIAIVAITVWIIQGKIIINPNLMCWFLFGIYALLSGWFIVDNKEYLESSIITLISFTIVCFMIYNLCIVFESTKWITDIIFIANVICAISVIFFGEDYNNGIHVITMGALNNPNYLGISMLYGIFACMTRINTRKWKNTLFYCFIIGVFSYVIILSGSRSSLIGLIVFFLVYFLSGSKIKSLTRTIETRHIIYFVVIVMGIYIIGRYILTEFTNTPAFERLLLLTEDDGARARTDLYDVAFMLFSENPIIGIGYNNFGNVAGIGYFSHSTYAETLACTGIIGCLLWFGPYFACAKKLFLLHRYNKEGCNRWIALYILIIFMGLFGIIYYVFQSMVVFTMLFAQMDIESSNFIGEKNEE